MILYNKERHEALDLSKMVYWELRDSGYSVQVYGLDVNKKEAAPKDRP